MRWFLAISAGVLIGAVMVAAYWAACVPTTRGWLPLFEVLMLGIAATAAVIYADHTLMLAEAAKEQIRQSRHELEVAHLPCVLPQWRREESLRGHWADLRMGAGEPRGEVWIKLENVGKVAAVNAWAHLHLELSGELRERLPRECPDGLGRWQEAAPLRVDAERGAWCVSTDEPPIGPQGDELTARFPFPRLLKQTIVIPSQGEPEGTPWKGVDEGVVARLAVTYQDPLGNTRGLLVRLGSLVKRAAVHVGGSSRSSLWVEYDGSRHFVLPRDQRIRRARGEEFWAYFDELCAEGKQHAAWARDGAGLDLWAHGSWGPVLRGEPGDFRELEKDPEVIARVKKRAQERLQCLKSQGS